MYITVTIEGKGNSREISLDSGMHIVQSLKDLKASGIDFGISKFVRSVLQDKVIKTDVTFEEAKITTGDRLIVLS